MAALDDVYSHIQMYSRIDIANNTELRANAQNILTSIRAARPKNTQLAYNSKQKEFQVGYHPLGVALVVALVVVDTNYPKS
jgi:hypothetical protein